MSTEEFQNREQVPEKSEHTSASQLSEIRRFFETKYSDLPEPTGKEVDEAVSTIYDENRHGSRAEAFDSDEFKKEVVGEIIKSRSSNSRSAMDVDSLL